MAVVAALQTAPLFGKREQNFDAVRQAVGALRCDLLVLPELFATGYAFRDAAEARSMAEPFPDGPTVRLLEDLSASTGGAVVGGLLEQEGTRLYNAAAVACAGRARLCYRKVHLFGFEREVFEPGPGPFPVFEHAGLKVGVMICFDWRFPEAARTLALAGADVLAHPSNLVLPHCQAAMVTRALENVVYAVTANRVGTEERPPRPPLTFTGASQILSPRGEVVAKAPIERPALLSATIDPALARDKRLASGNDVFGDRRPDTYAR